MGDLARVQLGILLELPVLLLDILVQIAAETRGTYLVLSLLACAPDHRTGIYHRSIRGTKALLVTITSCCIDCGDDCTISS